MWLCAGLGNPGRKYDGTRHNAGFMVIDRLSEAHGIGLSRRLLYSYGQGAIGSAEIVLLKPLVYMNRSGLALQSFLSKYRIPPDRWIIIHDDLDLRPGMLKIRRCGSSGGHKGVESVIQVTGTSGFTRVKIGIGREPGIPAEDYVLRRFSADERGQIKEAVDRARLAVESIITDGIGSAMNTYNRANTEPERPDERHDR